MANTCDLEGWIKKSHLTRQELAALMGISPMSLYRKIHNRSDFRADEIAAISRILRLSRRDRDRLFFDSESDLQSRKVTPRKVGSFKGRWIYGREGEAAPPPQLEGQLTLDHPASDAAVAGQEPGGGSQREAAKAGEREERLV